jgi:hypothetical protein
VPPLFRQRGRLEIPIASWTRLFMYKYVSRNRALDVVPADGRGRHGRAPDDTGATS